MGLFDGTPLERPVLCERCGEDEKVCQCAPVVQEDVQSEVAPSLQKVSVRVEKRKRGKLVTTVSGLTGTKSQQQSLLTALKDYCGAGGTQSVGQVEIQGDHKQRIGQFLQEQGYRLQ